MDDDMCGIPLLRSDFLHAGERAQKQRVVYSGGSRNIAIVLCRAAVVSAVAVIVGGSLHHLPHVRCVVDFIRSGHDDMVVMVVICVL